MVIVAFINRKYFFQAAAFAIGDQAANTLNVLRCKKFQDYVGNYSRWGFYHPGPFLFYYLAAAETIFWQLLHLTPAPFNAQVLGALCLTAGCFAVGVAIAARWVRSPFFVPLAVLLGALHYTAVHLQFCMLDTWTAYVATLPYFCLVVATASVAAGQGEDLPWLVFVGCVLIHIHVANPLFVLPLFMLGYGGLLWACRAGWSAPAADPPGVAQPWKRFPRAHIFAGVLAAAFAFPIFLDLCHGANSNFALILKHMRTHHGEHHTYTDALYYVLSFGAYKPAASNPGVIKETTPGIIYHFLTTHYKMLFLWTGALFSPLLALGLRFGLKPMVEAGCEKPAERLDGARWRFLGWLLVCFAVGTLLALFWAHIQDGVMYFFNAWYIYSLYGILTLVAAAASSDALERIVARFRRPRLLTAAIVLLCVVATEAFFGWPNLPVNNIAVAGNYDFMHTQFETVQAALALHPDSPRTKFLVIPDDAALGTAPGIAVMLKRRGYDFRVIPRWWKIMFGYETALPDSWLAPGTVDDDLSTMEPWWIVRPDVTRSGAVIGPLVDNFALKIGYSEIDPAKESAVVFAGPECNSETYALAGFLPPGPGSTWTWTADKMGRLIFEARPVPPESMVEIALDFWPPLINGTTHPSQRLQVYYNTTFLGTITVGADTPADSLRFRVPAAIWNMRPMAFLSLGFPDAISPAELDNNSQGDPRVMGFSARKITFRLASSTEKPSPTGL